LGLEWYNSAKLLSLKYLRKCFNEVLPMSEMIFCQSCGVPLENEEMKGMNADGSKSDDYCAYCYQNGAFTHDMSMDEMIEINLKYLDEWNKNSGQNLTVEEARKELKIFMPSLKRWKQKQ